MSDVVNKDHKNNGGETPGVRGAIDRFVKQGIANGMPPAKAEAEGRKQAIRSDRQRER